MHRVLLALAFLLPGAALAADEDAGEFVATYAKTHGFSGSVLVEKRGSVVVEESMGMASIPFSAPNTADTKFWIASITKAFTAALILQLRDAGRLDLDDSIATHLPGYRGTGAKHITIHQLLNHTSGLPNFDQVTDAADAIAHGLPTYQTPRTSDQLLADFCSGDPLQTPGSNFDYNNGDYIVLGKIVERLHGKPFGEVLQERVLTPLRMHDSGLLQQAKIIPGLAETYFFRDDLGALAHALPVYPENWYAAGAMYSTPRDLLRFADALFDAKLVSADSLARMLASGLDDHGYGVWSYDRTIRGRSVHIVKRPGRIMGANAQLYRVVEDDITIVLLANTDAADLDEFVGQIAERVAD